MARVTKKEQKKFIERLRSGATVTRVCTEIGRARTTMYRRRDESPEFAEEWDQAETDGRLAKVTELEEEADRRAIQGTLEPIFYKGKACGAKRRFSDTLLLARLKALDPEKYGDKSKVDLTGNLDVAGLIVLGEPSTDAEEWHAKHAAKAEE